MSEENVEAFKRAVETFNRRDVEALLQVVDPGIEWHPAIQVAMGGEPTVYRGHEGMREFVRDLDETFVEFQVRIDEIRDLGARLVAFGPVRARGKASGAETESPRGWLAEYRNGRAIRMWTFLDPKDALEAAGLSE